MAQQENVVTRVRRVLLSKAHSISGFARIFRAMDDNGDKRLDKTEFKEGLQNYGIQLSRQDVDELFAYFDQGALQDGRINFDELLRGLRGELNGVRLAVVQAAFAKFDADGNGTITIADIRANYDASHDPRVIRGEKTADEVFAEFLNAFEGGAANAARNGTITRAEFEDYYKDISSSLDDDNYFVEMIKRCWKLEEFNVEYARGERL
eukprot:TRINITY_DN4440_c0_g2_i1.p1 TRINITY_DN4440_c0_g2~~TRINITY_DN4440_c0_g2_i1.p1  ORF type:complete len:208 (+),score=95.13 TRINITY_DN4440_c0_g2_i1:86-709(+)